MSVITAYVHSINAKNNTLLCISCSTCPTVYVNKHLSYLTYGRVQTKGRNYVGTRNLRIGVWIWWRRENVQWPGIKRITKRLTLNLWLCCRWCPLDLGNSFWWIDKCLADSTSSDACMRRCYKYLRRWRLVRDRACHRNTRTVRCCYYPRDDCIIIAPSWLIVWGKGG